MVSFLAEREAQMIKCSNNRCCNGSWFHADCVRVDNTDGYADRDWWCSPECQDSRASIFCSCKTVLGTYKSCI